MAKKEHKEPVVELTDVDRFYIQEHWRQGPFELAEILKKPVELVNSFYVTLKDVTQNQLEKTIENSSMVYRETVIMKSSVAEIADDYAKKTTKFNPSYVRQIKDKK